MHHAAAAAAREAVKASGAIVLMETESFLQLLAGIEEPLVIRAPRRFFMPRWRYLTSYKGFVFATSSREELMLPGKADIIEARQIWLPQ
jgi:hypothetical protein